MENGNDRGGENGTRENSEGRATDDLPRSRRPIPVPPPEAFRRVGSIPFFDDPDNKGDNSRNQRKDPPEATTASIASAVTLSSSMPAPKRPSLLIRRQSSLFGQLPVRAKSRLFGDIGSSSSNDNDHDHANTNANANANANAYAGESIAGSTAMNHSRSQSTWLQDDHQSTLMGDEGGSKIPSQDDNASQWNRRSKPPSKPQKQQQQQQQQGKSSLFGAVMQKFGSGISSAFPMQPPSSPFGKRRSSSVGYGNVDASPQTNSHGGGSGGGGAFRSLIGSPSGKTIMSIVNQFHSPFKFQSPGSGDKKRRGRRRRLWRDDGDEDEDEDEDGDAFTTPTRKRRRVQLDDDDDDETSKPSGNNLFPDHDNNDSRSSLGGGIVDENWREAPIVDSESEAATGTRMEFLDWSLPTRVRIEVHGCTPREQHPRTRRILHSWIRDVMRDNHELLAHWIYDSPRLPNNDVPAAGHGPGSTGTQTQQGPWFSARSNGAANLATLPKSIASAKSMPSRQDSLSKHRTDSRPCKTRDAGGDNDDSSSGTADRLAKYLITSVRGPRARCSRKRILEEPSWWEEPATNGGPSTLAREDARGRLQRQWQQAIRSLFSKYRRRTMLHSNDDTGSRNSMVLGTYFYCIGEDHSVLFRVAVADDSDSDDQRRDAVVPVVLISSTSKAFRNLLEQNGLNPDGSDPNKERDESVEYLESIPEREARERKRIAAAVQKNKRLFNKAILSPGVSADLEALRRAQAFGESAGADFLVKVKKAHSGSADTEKNDNLPKAMRISGWDNVSAFFEVYWNQLGDVMGSIDEIFAENGISFHPKTTDKRLPLLVCPNTKGLGSFEHASMKSLRFFPTEATQAIDSQTKTGANGAQEQQNATNHSNGIDVRGILLPCAIRKLLLLARKEILNDEKQVSESHGGRQIDFDKAQQTNEPDTSRFVVLHSIRSRQTARKKKEGSNSLVGGLAGTMVFNQGRKRKRKPAEKLKKDDAHENSVFECAYGKVVSMAVWDTQREEVAACKLDNAFPDDWFKVKN